MFEVLSECVVNAYAGINDCVERLIVIRIAKTFRKTYKIE